MPIFALYFTIIKILLTVIIIKENYGRKK